MKHTIFIAGSGGIGEAAALLLREWSSIEVDLFLGDINEANLLAAKDFVLKNSKKISSVETVLMTTNEINDAMRAAFDGCNQFFLLISCFVIFSCSSRHSSYLFLLVNIFAE